MGWFSTQLTGLRKKMILDNRRFDDTVFTWMAASVARAYTLVSGFFWSHALGPVFGETLTRRKGCCASCPKMKRDELGHDRCMGFPDGDCQCPKWWWWIPGRLWWQRGLRNWTCPQGFWGRLKPTGIKQAVSSGILRRAAITRMIREIGYNVPAVIWVAVEIYVLWMALSWLAFAGRWFFR